MADVTPSAGEARAVLGVPGSATPAQVVAAFRRLARVLHPDVNHVPDAACRFAGLVAAYQVALGAARASSGVEATGPPDARGAEGRTPVSASPTPGGRQHVVAGGGATIVREAGRVVLVVGPVAVRPPSARAC